MKIVRQLLTLPIVLTLCLTISASSVAADVAQGEREFLLQLLDRGLFDLAEQFCQRRLQGQANANERADWESILSECQQQHAWFMDDDSRNGLISQSAQRISEFLESNTPTAEKDILLRVRHLELLAAAGVMEQTVQAPLSSSFRPDRSKATDAIPSEFRRVTSSTQFALEAAHQGDTIGNALLKQIDEIRRDVDSDVVRTARERIRMALAEMTFTRARLGPSTESAMLITEADDLFDQLQKTVTQDTLRFRCRIILTEIQLERGDFSAFKLRFGNVSSSAGTSSERAQAAALKIRSLLFQGQPSEALQEYVQASKDELTLTQELQTLRLQALLELMELLHYLDDSPQRTEAKTKTADEFTQLQTRTLSLTSGVWRQRCLRLIDHFQRVLQVGPEVARDLNQASILVELNKVNDARHLLQSLVKRLSSTDRNLAAKVLVQSGNLSVGLKDWKSASIDFERATDLFVESKDDAAAAAADLLRVYVTGQQWDSDSASGVTEQHYREAIEQHLQRFPNQSTAAEVREWRARLLKNIDPLGSARDLLAIVSANRVAGEASAGLARTPSKSCEQLCLAGDLLLEAMARGPNAAAPAATPGEADSGSMLIQLSAAFNTEMNAFALANSSSPCPDLAFLEAQQLGLLLLQRLPTNATWSTMSSDARRLQNSMQDVVQTQTPTPAEASVRSNLQQSHANATEGLKHRAILLCDALIVLSSIRQLEDSATYESAQASLLKQSATDRFRVASQLMRQLGEKKNPIAGDAQLAHVIIRLVTLSEPADKAFMTIDNRIEQLRMLRPLSAVLGSNAAIDRAIAELVELPLAESQLNTVAGIMSHSPPVTGSSSASGSSSALSTRRFWQLVQKKTKPGQDAWFEASLQMAILAEAAGEKKEAVRILGIVSVLHPEWGTPSRKVRAEELRLRLEKTP